MKSVFLLLLVSFALNSWSLAQTENKEDLFELTSINFSGNRNISSGELKSIIVSKETPMWVWKFLNSFTSLGKGAVYFDSAYIPRDIKIIENFYRDKGFFKVKVFASFQIDTTDKEAVINFIIEENDRAFVNIYKYPSLEQTLDSAFFQDFFRNKFKTKSGLYFSRENVENDIAHTLTELKNFGYMLAEKKNTIVDVDTVTNLVDIRVNIEKGKYYVIDTVRTEIKGPGKDDVTDELILNIVDINKGDKYNLFEINQAQVRLYRTELFTSALINSVIADTNYNRVPLMVSLDVGRINELSPEFLINNQQSTFNVGLGLNYIRKNFFGNARKFTINTAIISQDIFRLNIGNVLTKTGLNDTTVLGQVRATIGIEQPYFIDKSITGTLDLIGIAEQQKIYKYLSFGTKMGLRFSMPAFTFFTGMKTSLAYENETIFIRKEYIREALQNYYKQQGVPITDKELDDLVDNTFANKLNLANIILGIDLIAFHANDIFFPTLGYNVQLNIENGGLLPLIKNLFTEVKDQNSQYYKINLLTTAYTNPWKPAFGAVAYKLRLGYMQKYNGGIDIPVTKLFYAGGSNSIRGWAARSLGTISSITSSDGKTINVAENGGRFIFEGSIETRNKILGDLGAAIFFDFGNNWNDLKSFTWNTNAIAAGLGLRYYSSFAPFRLDFGFKLYDPFQKKFNFNNKFFDNIEIHFGIGEAF